MVKFYLLVGVLLGASMAYGQASEVKQEILNAYGCSQNSFVCKAINENLKRDSNMCRVFPYYVDALGTYIKQTNPGLARLNVLDRIRYWGPISGKYSYEYQKLNNGTFKITAKMHFKNLSDYSDVDVQILKDKFKRAARIWNLNNPFKKSYSFDFQVAEKRTNRTVAAELVKYPTRGPYFDRWSTRWNEYTIAHEFGHVMGLFDEYDYFHDGSGRQDCDPSSIMCSSYGAPKPFHYHLILQRGFCEV